MSSTFQLDRFPDAYRDTASMRTPVALRHLLRWCEQVWLANRTYSKSIERVISYFMTPIGVSQVGDEQSLGWQALLDDVVGAREVVKHGLIDSRCYGTGFITPVVPFRRFLVCPKRGCGSLELLESAAERSTFRWQIPDFVSNCRGCGYSGKMDFRDQLHNVEDNLRFRRWSPHEIEIVHNLETGQNRFIWRIPPDYRALLRRTDCDVYHLARAQRNVIQAVATNQLFEFHKDAIFQILAPTLAGLPLRGWGMPDPLLHHRRLYRIQVLHRQNEALGEDYITPYRVITPAPRQGSGTGGGIGLDPIYGHDARQQAGAIREMIRVHRQDPASIHMMPFPLQYQVFGGEGRQFAPVDLLTFEQDGLMSDAGPPAELWKGTMQLSAAPVSLRLMETEHSEIVSMGNALLAWMGKTISQLLSWEAAKLEFQRVTMADDVDRHVLALQLVQAGKISDSTLLTQLGYDNKTEARQRADDQVFAAEEQSRVQSQLEDAGLTQQLNQPAAPGGQPGSQPGSQPGGQPGGAPGAGSGDSAAGGGVGGMSPQLAQYMSTSSAPQTLDDMMSAATTIAQDLIQRSPQDRYSALRQLSRSNEPLHRLVTGQLAQLRSGIRSQAYAGAVNNMQGGGAPG